MVTRVKQTIEKITSDIIRINNETSALWYMNSKLKEKNHAVSKDIYKSIEKNKKAFVYFARDVSRLKK